jgi:hypothetical protein
MVAFKCEEKNQYDRDLNISFVLTDSQISPTDLINWNNERGDPCAFLAIRHERYAYSKMIEFGYFDTGLNDWVTKHSPCFAMIVGNYSIKIVHFDDYSQISIYKNTVMIETFIFEIKEHQRAEKIEIKINVFSLGCFRSIYVNKELFYEGEKYIKQSYGNCLLVTMSNNNEKYLRSSKNVFLSAYYNGKWDGDFLFLNYDFGENEWFRNNGIQSLKFTNEDFNDLTNFHINKMYYYGKFILFKTMFKKWDYIMFLDADCFINSTIKKIELIDNFAAVPKYNFIHACKVNKSAEEGCFKDFKEEYDMDSSFFGTGCMIIDTKMIKENDETFFDLCNLTNKYGQLIKMTPEESIINFFISKINWTRLPCIYDFIIGHNLFISEQDKTNIINYHIYSPKPWISENNPLYGQWSEMLKNRIYA